MADPDEVFCNYPPASWTVGGRPTLKFPVLRVEESGGNRIIERERPFRDGAKLDDTGSKAKRWVLTVCFNNSIEETDVLNADPLYPDVLNQLTASFDVHETGDIVVPTIGVQRARAESYHRVETQEARDEAEVVFTWIEDNEDSVNFRSISAPTVNANARRLALQTTFDQESIESADESLDSLRTSMQNLEDFSNSPTAFQEEIEQAANSVKRAAKKGKQIFSQPGKPGRDTFTSAQGARPERQMTREEDMAGRATNDARAGRPAIIRVQVGGDTNLVSVAAFLGQPYEDLLAINTLPNPNFLPPGSIIKVFANTGNLQQQGRPQSS